ncbi:MAG: hypothetical protein RLZZ09_832 [Pseudomonadota bacterium]|jgi:hypothetical protein
MLLRSLIHLSRALCLLLVLATGMSGIAFANHDGSHGSHCIDSSQMEFAASHDTSLGVHNAGDEHKTTERSCVQHSCVAVVPSLSLEPHGQRLASEMPVLRGDLLRASLSAESLHRPPIV